MFKKKNPANLLSMHPLLNERYSIKKAGDAECLVIPRNNWVEKIGVKYFQQSPEHRYRLDSLGSFVLNRCNGSYTVSDIEHELREAFGKEAEPTLNRLVKFLQILDNNCVITFRKTGAD